MPNILLLGYTAEGSTDKRFFEPIIERTFNHILIDSNIEIDVYRPMFLSKKSTGGFNESLTTTAIEAADNGIMILCVHCDADAAADKETFINKINPAFSTIKNYSNPSTSICKNLCAIVPVYMTESWMLADKELFKDAILSDKSNEELGIQHAPENYNDPKNVINEAIRISQEALPKKSRNFAIADLYQPLGQQISIDKLMHLSSFRKFANAARSALMELHYLH